MRLDPNTPAPTPKRMPTPGWHRAVVSTSEEKTSSNGNPMFALVWTITDGEFKGESVRSWLVMSDGAKEFTHQNLRAILNVDVLPEELVDVDLIGMRCGIKLVASSYQDPHSGQQKPCVEIKGYQQPQNPPPQAQTQAQAQPQPQPAAAPASNANDDDIPF